MAGVSLSILTETGQSSAPAVIQTQSKVFWLPAPCSSSSSSSYFSSASMFPEPAAKRSKQHNDLNTCRLAVTAVTRLTPLLNSGCVKCSVMLHYIQQQEAFTLMSNSIPFVLYCGQVTLDIHHGFQTQLLKNPDLRTGKNPLSSLGAQDLGFDFCMFTCIFFFLCPDEVKEDFLSLIAVLDHWVFNIDSPDYSLGDVEGWLHKRMGCKRIEVSPQYLLDSSEPYALVLLHWHQLSTFQGELSIHSR